jgi:hypothetical protein
MKRVLFAMMLAGAPFAHAQTYYNDDDVYEQGQEISDKLDEINDKLDEIMHVKHHYALPKLPKAKEIGYVDKDGKMHWYKDEDRGGCTP